MKHEEAADGLWVTSDNPELWMGYDGFWDTREEAIAAAEEHHHLVGQVTVMSDAEVVDAFLRDIQDAEEHIGIQDEWVWCEDGLIDPPSDEAATELRSLVTAWVRKHRINRRRWYVNGEEIGGGAS